MLRDDSLNTLDAWLKARRPWGVRVAGFDAPERGQPFSNVATQMMRDLTQGGALCDCYKQDRYKRNVCTVRTRDGQNVATLMLRAALAHAQDTRRGM
jgi:endonuclease YncB( thermonuclease family)